MEKELKRSLQSRFALLTNHPGNGRAQSEWIAALQNRFNIVARITVDAEADNDERDRILAPLRNRNTFLAKCFLLLLPPASFHLVQRTAKAFAYRILPLHPYPAFNCDRWKKRNIFFFFSLNLRETNEKFASNKISILKCA